MKTLTEYKEELGNLNKQRASKVEELEAVNAKEDFTDADQTKYDNLKKEIDDIDAKRERVKSTISAREEQQKIENSGDNFMADFPAGPDGEEKEIQSFSFMDFFKQADGRKPEGFTAEMHQEGVKEARESGVSLKGQGLVMPRKVMTKKKLNIDAQTRRQFLNDVQAGGSGTGSENIETESIDFVGLLYDALVLRGLGARFVTGLQGNIPLTNQSSGFTFGWAATENATASESTPAYSQATLSPKRGTGFMDVSNMYLTQASPDMERELVLDMINATRVGIDTAAINGQGSSGEPEGILNKSGIGAAYAGGAAGSGTNANGAAHVWADWVNVEKAVDLDNANMGSTAFLTNSKVKAQARLTKVDSGSGIFIWDKLVAEDANIGVTNAVPSDLSKGTSNDLSALIYGNFRDLWIGQWGGLEVFRNPYTKAKDDLTEMLIHVYIDVAIRRAESFAAVQDIDAQ